MQSEVMPLVSSCSPEAPREEESLREARQNHNV